MTDVLPVNDGAQLKRIDGTIYTADASNGNITLTLPTVSDLRGIRVKKIDGTSNTVTLVPPSGESVDGGSSVVLSSQYEERHISSTGLEYVTDAQQGYKSLSVDRAHTKSRRAAYQVHKTGGTIYADGPSGPLYDGSSFVDALQAAHDDASATQSAAIHPDTYTWGKQLSITKPFSLISDGAEVTLADGVNAAMIATNVDQTAASFEWEIPRIEGFRVDGNDANNTGGKFIVKKSTDNLQGLYIENNHFTNFADSLVHMESGAAWNVHFVHNTGNGNSSMTSPALLLRGWNWVAFNDFDGGVHSRGNGGNWIVGNSIYLANAFDGIRSQAGNDFIYGNYVIDNDQHGIQVQRSGDGSGHRRTIIAHNIVQNNSVQSDNTYSGITLSGYPSGSAGDLHDVIVANNNCFNIDPTDPGVIGGVQKYGIQLNYEMQDVLIQGNNVRTDFGTGSVGYNSFSGTNVQIKDNIGYVTQASGSASVADTGTIAHGLDKTDNVVVMLTGSADGHIAVATAVGSSNITVGLHDDAGSAVTIAETVYWEAWDEAATA